MYRNIFPTQQFKLWSLVMLALSLAWWIAQIVATLLQCRPIWGMWNLTMILAACSHVNKMAMFLGSAIPNTIIDVFLLILPLSQVAKLPLDRPKKVGVYVIFALGGL